MKGPGIGDGRVDAKAHIASLPSRVRTMIEETHEALNKAAVGGYLSSHGVEARQLCAEALRRVAANGGRWDNAAMEKIRAASKSLEQAIKDKQPGERAEFVAHATCREAVSRISAYLSVRDIQRRGMIEDAVKDTTGDLSRTPQTWSKRAEALAALRGTANRKKGIGY